MLHLDFLYETGSFKNIELYNQFKNEYEALSKRINTFTKWVEDNWNDFNKPETDNK
jgi:hypothetical protein